MVECTVNKKALAKKNMYSHMKNVLPKKFPIGSKIYDFWSSIAWIRCINYDINDVQVFYGDFFSNTN